MKVNYEYSSPSMCLKNGNETTLGLSPDISRDEKVSFLGKLKHPLIFRDAMLTLRQIVVSDSRLKKKERVEFFQWLDGEIERRIKLYEENVPNIREDIKSQIDGVLGELEDKNAEIIKLIKVKDNLKKEIDKKDFWSEYYKLERSFWKFIKERDLSLWYVLDPVITVHPDKVSFEAFSVDESIYGCLSIDMDEFELLQKPSLGTTNIDFSEKLAKEIERFRTYTDVSLSINPEGFSVDNKVLPEHMEKKIELPESWIKGFNQVSSAGILNGIDIDLFPVDMYDICSFLKRHKANKSPRYMEWILEPKKPIKIIFYPFKKELTLRSIYKGDKKRQEKIWGRERWLIVEKLIPIVKSFKIKLLGFGMPQFIIGDLGSMKLTIGFTSWSSNDWVKGTSFNILAGFIGDGNYEEVYKLLKEKRNLSIDDIFKNLNEASKNKNKSGLGMLFKRGEGYFDVVDNKVRFRRLCKEDIKEELYKTTPTELKVKEHMEAGMDNFRAMFTENNEFIFSHKFKKPNSKYKNWKYYGTDEFNKEFDLTDTILKIDNDGQIVKVKCNCKEFNKGARNISEPCSHILALYLISSKFLKLKLDINKEYKINDIMETLL